MTRRRILSSLALIAALGATGAVDGHAAMITSQESVPTVETRPSALVRVDTAEAVDLTDAYRELAFDTTRSWFAALFAGQPTAWEAVRIVASVPTAAAIGSWAYVSNWWEQYRGRLPKGRMLDNIADARLHSLTSFILCRWFDADIAKRLGDAYEHFVVERTSSRLMDLFNNRVGRGLALRPDNRERSASTVIDEAIVTGSLRDRPFPVK